jgi:hypothetical protein
MHAKPAACFYEGGHSCVSQAEIESLAAQADATCIDDARVVPLDARPAHTPSCSTPSNVQRDVAAQIAVDLVGPHATQTSGDSLFCRTVLAKLLGEGGLAWGRKAGQENDTTKEGMGTGDGEDAS